MSSKKQTINWIIRILIFIVFILSAVSKMLPIWQFEKQLVDLNLFNWCQAPYVARFIIGLELAIGIAFLQKHYVKKLVIPITILLLAAFCIHLCMQMVEFGPMNGNCGCFGQLIPMTPLEAFIKNVITIALLIYLYRNSTEYENRKLLYPILIFIASLAVMFIFFKIPPCTTEEVKPLPTIIPQDTTTLTDIKPVEEIVKTKESEKTTITEEPKSEKTEGGNKKDSVQTKPAPVKKQVPQGHTQFAKYTTFGDKKVNLDEGRKVVCMFAAGCDHCRAAAKEICALAKADPSFPEVYILFMDEETFLINDFFKEAQCTYPYQILNIPEFWSVLGTGKSTPGVFLLNNGNIVKWYEGINDNKFEPEAFKKVVVSTK
jgi:hypothetical protein